MVAAESGVENTPLFYKQFKKVKDKNLITMVIFINSCLFPPTSKVTYIGGLVRYIQSSNSIFHDSPSIVINSDAQTERTVQVGAMIFDRTRISFKTLELYKYVSLVYYHFPRVNNTEKYIRK